MAKPLLHHRKHILVAAAFGIEQAVRREPGQSEAGREQIGPAQRPQHRARRGARRCRRRTRWRRHRRRGPARRPPLRAGPPTASPPPASRRSIASTPKGRHSPGLGSRRPTSIARTSARRAASRSERAELSMHGLETLCSLYVPTVPHQSSSGEAWKRDLDRTRPAGRGGFCPLEQATVSTSAVQVTTPATSEAASGLEAGSASAAALLRGQESRLLDPPVDRLGAAISSSAPCPASPMRWAWSFVLHTALLTATGYSITLLMAAAYRRLIRMKPLITWPVSIAIVHHRRRRLLGDRDLEPRHLRPARRAAGRHTDSSARSCSPSPCSSPGRRSITASIIICCSRSRPTGCCGSSIRRRAPSSRCCATSSTRISCSTR